MPIGNSNSPFRPKSRGATARGDSPPPVPPKAVESLRRNVIDLNSSTGSYDRSSGSKVARRAVLCDVVVERHGEETAGLLAQLGQTLEPGAPQERTPLVPATPSDPAPPSWDPSKREEMEHRLRQLSEELIRTERSYVSRIEALQKYYAGPLRFFAKKGNTVIIPKYHAKTLFGNIDAVFPAAQTFLNDLEEIYAAGLATTALGDVCLRHLKTLKTLEPYGTYIGNQDEAQKIFQELYRNDRSFVQFVDATKQQTTGISNIGLRELLMEPVQRIPRYTMLWQSIAKCLPPHSEQRSKLLESVDIASRIARCEADEQTVRATVMYCLQRNIDGIPASLFSNHRNFIDSIDAEELFPDAAGGSMRTAPRAGKPTPGGLSVGTPADVPVPPLHCTLFLFDDQLIIAKRPSVAVSGRKLTGLDDIPKLVRTGGGIAVKEKDGVRKERLSFRGAVDILKLTGMDLGSGDFQVVFDGHSQTTPVFGDQSDRWVGRPVRNYSTIHPPQPVGFDPVTCRTDKNRFLSNLWAAQALCRTRPRHKMVEPVCRALECPDDVDIPGELIRVKPYWNLWDRAGWTATDRKSKIVVQLSEDDDIPELPLPQDGGPMLVIRLEVMPGAVCKVQAVTNTGQEVLRTATSVGEVNGKIVEAINMCDLFKVRIASTGNTTPSSNASLFSKRASRFGTDIARNLWGNTASSRGHSDGFGSTSTKTNSSKGHDRTRSADMLTISSVSTNPPKTPKSERSPISPASPISIVEMSSNSGHHANYDESQVPVLTPVKEMFSPTKSPLHELRSPGGPQRSMSRVAAMRQQLERKMHEESQETLTTPVVSPGKPQTSPTRPLPSPGPQEGKPRNRVPVPTLASSVFRAEGGLSRDSSLNSLPGSPSKGTSLSRNVTLGPRGPRPRGAIPRNGYVPPLPPPVSEDGLSSIHSSVVAHSGASCRTLPHPPGPLSAIHSPHLAYSSQPNSSLASNTAHSFATHSDHTSLQSNTGHSALSAIPPVNANESEELDSYEVPQPETLRVVEAVRTDRGIGLGAPPKRAHDEDHLSPRKRSASGNSSIMARVDSDGRGGPTSTLGPAPGLRHTSGKIAPRNTSRRGAFSPGRKVSNMSNMTSASIASSLNTLASAVDDTDLVMSDHLDLPSASDSVRANIADARKLARRIRMDAITLRKIRSPMASSSSTLSRSPSSSALLSGKLGMNIHGVLADATNDLTKADVRDMDELARHIASAGEKLETKLTSALADSERVRMLARQIDESGMAYEGTITTMEGQLGRAKEREDLLADQLRRRDLELEEIYNAFNTELDSMYNDMTLPRPDAAGAALRVDLQAAKGERNALELENKRLKLELEEERLKREHWSQLLHARGLL